MATLPQQAPGPNPTDLVLPSYLSYSPVATRVVVYTSTQVNVVYDPLGVFAPYQTDVVIHGTTIQTDYSIVNVPLLYTGPLPPPPLGTAFTTPGQVLSSPAPVSSPSATPTSHIPSNAVTQASSVPPITQPSASPTGNTSASLTAIPTSVITSAISTTSLNTLSSSPSTRTATPTFSSSSSPSSLSISSASSSSSSSSSSTSSAPTTSSTVAPIPDYGSHLSSGQIAGIVVGSILGLLLLLLLFCILRRRYSNRAGRDVSAAATVDPRRGQRPYAALGTGAVLAAARNRGSTGGVGDQASLDSDEYEEDHLTGGGRGSGFFVVGGKRQASGDRRSSFANRQSGMVESGPHPNVSGASYTANNLGRSSPSPRGKAAIGLGSFGLGTGLLASALGRKRSRKAEEIPHDETGVMTGEESQSDEEGSVDAERRGLMDFALAGSHGRHARGDSEEMRQVGGSGLLTTPTTPLGYRPGLARRSESPGSSVPSLTNLDSSAGHHSGTSLPPPPRQQRDRVTPPLHDYRNQAPQGVPVDAASISHSTSEHPKLPSFGDQFGSGEISDIGIRSPDVGAEAGGGEENQFITRPSRESLSSQGSHHGGINPALLGVGGAAALGGLTGLAAGHRESSQSTYSTGFYPSGVSSSAAAALRGNHGPSSFASHSSENPTGGSSGMGGEHLHTSDAGRHSRFISAGSNLLGPEFSQSSSDSSSKPSHAPSSAFPKDQRPSDNDLNSLPYFVSNLGSTSGFFRTRLPTIQSIDEFGERPNSRGTTQASSSIGVRSDNMGTGSARGTATATATRSLRGTSWLPAYGEDQLQGHRRSGSSSRGGESLPPYNNIGHQEKRFSKQSKNSLGGHRRRGEWPSFDSAAGKSTDQYISDHEGPSTSIDETRTDLMSSQDTHNGHSAAAGVSSSGSILGGISAGWRRLTMGQYAWISGSGGTNSDSRLSRKPFIEDEIESGRVSPTESDIARHAISPREGSPQVVGRLLAADVRSEHASVYGPSMHDSIERTPSNGGTLSGQHSSREASGDTGKKSKTSWSSKRLPTHMESAETEVIAPGASSAGSASIDASSGYRRYAAPSMSSASGQSARGGYSASISNSSASGRRNGSISTGFDSLSQVANLSSSNTGSSSNRSGYVSSRGGRSTGRSVGGGGGASSQSGFGSSGASTGAASYSPSLTRGNTTSTRAGDETFTASSQAAYLSSRPSFDGSTGWMTDVVDDGSEARSSRATQGNSSSFEKRKRPRSSSVDGLSRLASLSEVRESDPFADDIASASGSSRGELAAARHFPSESLGAAVLRSAYRDVHAQQQQRVRPPGMGILSLQPGGITPAPATLSVPSLIESDERSRSFDLPSTSSWRPSPRVASAAQRAAERLEQQRDSESSSSPSQVTHIPNDLESQDSISQQQQTGLWNKFLKF